ncbi:MAG: cell division protein FtsL [Clostridia bacterium]|nr:cell division protein FtsL [Clostridia bacterium]
MTGYQITASDLSGFKKYDTGLRARYRYEEYLRNAQKKRLTPEDKLARIEALDRKAPIRNLARCCAHKETEVERRNGIVDRLRADVTVKGNFPAVSVMLTFVFACILTMVVYSSVQYSDARKEYSALRDELAASDSEIVRLEGEKDARVDLEEVERIAVDELGMIQKDKAENVYVSVSANDNVVLEKIEDQGEAETSLLSAFAERLKALWEYFN